jgi:hypothetical protein
VLLGSARGFRAAVDATTLQWQQATFRVVPVDAIVDLRLAQPGDRGEAQTGAFSFAKACSACQRQQFLCALGSRFGPSGVELRSRGTQAEGQVTALIRVARQGRELIGEAPDTKDHRGGFEASRGGGEVGSHRGGGAILCRVAATLEEQTESNTKAGDLGRSGEFG